MKLVKAKCPSCGAAIEVDKNSDTTKCDYCGSKIVVDDAIAKFKLEVSGEVEIKNLPKIEGYLKNGEREYKNYDYKEALNYYNKAIELDPDNPLVVLRVGICKSTLTTYNKFETNYAINALKDVLKLENDDDKLKKYITETYACIFKLEQLARNNWSSLDQFESTNITNYIERLNKCLLAYEYLFSVVKTKEFKITIITRIINIITEILSPKKYCTYNRSNGNKIYKAYLLDYNYSNALNQKYQRYINELNILNPAQAQVIINRPQPTNYDFKIVVNVIVYIVLGLITLLALINEKFPLFSLLLAAALVLYTLLITKVLFKNNKPLGIVVICILSVVGLIGSLIHSYPYFIDSDFKDEENNIYVKFNREDGVIKFNDEEGEKTYDLSYKEKDDYTLISLGDYQFKFQTNYNKSKEYLLCLLENDECKYFFVGTTSSYNFVSNMKEYQDFIKNDNES